jgi:ATP-dependent helicase/nuclease subunit A
MSLTSVQREAVAARGNVLVVAGAGTGKTHTLVERCVGCLLEEKPLASLDEILMVTFTEAAAAEMRQRIRDRLETELLANPENHHCREQLALFENAHIGTLHSFCLRLVREHFYQLDLDPQLTVLAEEEARLLAEETLDSLFQKHYAGRGAVATAVQQLIQSQGRGWDKPIRVLVLRVHHYTQTLPEPGAWLSNQLNLFADPGPALWREWLRDAVSDWCEGWCPKLTQLAGDNDLAAKCRGILEQGRGGNQGSLHAIDFQALEEAEEDCPRGKKTLWREPLENFFQESRFLHSLVPSDGKPDPLAEDWNWVRPQMATLLRLAEDFGKSFTEAKHELGVVDFHDLEQHALRLLWDPVANRPTPIAERWRNKLRFVFVDEYQDINAAQDQIIQALSRDGAGANRFLVGDIKQSIYRFRLANPRIFQSYNKNWDGPAGRSIPLVENFRSRESLLGFVNSLFTCVMREEVGGVRYDAHARLQFGAAASRKLLATTHDPSPRTELHLRVRAGRREEPDEPGELAEFEGLAEAEKEARQLALRLRELHAARHPVWDEASGGFRPVEWGDMAVLLRSPAGKIESYAKEFARLNVPLQAARGGFYESLEISDLISLLHVLDNPLQDIPVLAVLHSPLVGLTLDELGTIRLTVLKAHFWTALVRWKEAGGGFPTDHSRASKSRSGPESKPESAEVSEPREASPSKTAKRTYEKVAVFLDRFSRWRRLARQVSLSRCLEAVLSETHYADWLITQERGEQRRANVQRLLTLAEQFDQFQRQGLFRFLRFIEAQQLAEAEPQVAPVIQSNTIRLMSIHQSKGLEFPVVVVADLGKAFNLSDLRAEIILDERYGLCPQIKPPQTGKRYPSLPYWLGRSRQTKELLGEEMRLLYVALTRARDTLILSGCVSESKLNRIWRQSRTADLEDILAARCYADWLGLWFAGKCGPLDSNAPAQGENVYLGWFVHDELGLKAPDSNNQEPGVERVDTEPVAPETWQALEERLSWRYAHAAATREPAKTSVSELKRRAIEDAEDADLLLPRISALRHASQRTTPAPPETTHSGRANGKVSAAERGTAHHNFLRLVALDQTESKAALEGEAQRLQREASLRPEEVALLDFDALAAFWKSELGHKISEHRHLVQRELAFTATFPPAELAAVIGGTSDPTLAGEQVIVQGIADLVVLFPNKIWLIDFKTDRFTEEEMADRVGLYAPQLAIYAVALARIYERPIAGCWLYFFSCRRQVPVDLGSFGAGAVRSLKHPPGPAVRCESR